MSKEETPQPGTSDEALLQEIRTRFSEFSRFWDDNFKKGDDDIIALGDDGPMAEEKKVRELEKRPFIHQDIISQYNRRIKNQSRLSNRGIKINPAGENADQKTAERRENRIRQIDHESQAKHARQMALDHAIDRGFGFYCVYTEIDYVTGLQRIVTRPIPNPKVVKIWPYCKLIDRSDQEASFIIQRMSWDAFRQKYGNRAKIQSFADDMLNEGKDWANKEEVQVASYWKRTIGEDGKPKVTHYLTNGFEIISTEPWIGTTIPIVMVAGPEYYDKDGKLVIESATRKSVAAQKTYDYALMNQVERVGQIPKTKIWFAEGQQDTSTDFENLNRTPTGYGLYKRFIDGVDHGQPVFFDFTAQVQEMEILKQSAMVAIENAYGITSVQHQDKVGKSGVAMKELQESADVTNYHFQDSSTRAMDFEGRIKNEILEKVEDTATYRGFRTADDQYKNEQVIPLENPETGEIEHPYGNSDDHRVVVESGPDWNSQFDKVSESLDEAIQNPLVGPLVADLWIDAKRLGPKGDVIKKRIQAKFGLLEPGQEPDPQALMMELQQSRQQLQQANGLLQAAEKEIKEKNDQKAMELQSKERMNEETNAVKLTIADIQAQQKMTSDAIGAMVQKLELFLTGQEKAKDREHEQGMASEQRQHEAEQADRDRSLAAAQADQQAQLTREGMQQESQTSG